MSVDTVATKFLTFAAEPPGFELESGRSLSPVTIAYETYGKLNEAGDNAILILHGFTADAHAAGIQAGTGKLGWWDDMIGPGKAFDTRRFFVVSQNVIGGCGGSTGPSSVDPATGRPYALGFPVVTIRDMVNAQYRLLTTLGVTSLAAVSGASMGGHQALQWLASYPKFVRTAIPIACSARLSAQSLALYEVARQAIMTDPDWLGGDYYGKAIPARGLAVARMGAHLTYVSEENLESDFGRRTVEGAGYSYTIGGEFAVQAHLREEGDRFVKRFDANSYLYLSQAMEYFDLTRPTGSLTAAFESVRGRVLLLSFSSDWLFPAAQLAELEMVLRSVGASADHITIDTPFGHDAFLTDWRKISHLIAGFLAV
jgi:homoserine O-acetyltransferase